MHETVGKYTPAREHQPEIIERAYYGQGTIYKNWTAYETDPAAICYIPELTDTKYFRKEFLYLCNGNEELARELFLSVDWQCPETLIDEWKISGEIAICKNCGHTFDCYDDKKCPKCGTEAVESNT